MIRNAFWEAVIFKF